MPRPARNDQLSTGLNADHRPAWRLALVVPRYGEDVLGGAETFARCLAEDLVASGLADVEVLTTCAADQFSWANVRPAGTTQLHGVRVHRFPIDPAKDRPGYERLHARLIMGEWLPLADQYAWVHQSAHSSALYAALSRQLPSFDFVIPVPYLFGTTYYAAAIDPARTILWPCLHDEVYAYLQPTVDMFRACRGVLFNTLPEQQLAERLYGALPGGRIAGFGLDPFTASGDRFRRERGLAEPFILYSGRLEPSKNLPLLLSCFEEYKRRRRGPLKLALMGTGPMAIPRRADIVPLGFQQGQRKLDAYAAATLLCQPSVNESFSIVIMESWLAGVPVLVHSDCRVTRYHAERSQGGLCFRSYEEFEAILDLLLARPELRRGLGANGRAYVQSQYSWPAVLKRFTAALDSWRQPAQTGGAH